MILSGLTEGRAGEYEYSMEAKMGGWREGFLVQVRESAIPADDPFRPDVSAHVTIVESNTAKPLSNFEQKLAAQIEKEQVELFGGKILVMAVMPKNDGVEEHWPITVDDAIKNVMALLDRQLPSPD
ncbi:hypothetical protein HZB78_03870 [Candidatus Collierbacteria bacterium]|nr:hypothetical protein [Candidatus Collierbacteria bacterium]